ncbi:MAG: hypothetical protein GY847_09510 [Proteobacteria bacterium]|nr:hypothetical protein [Pseudomonadota bacterium]
MNIQHQWASMKCPIINGILFANGDIEWINVGLLPQSGGMARIQLSPGRPTDVKTLTDEGVLDWTEVAPLCEAIDEKRNIRVFAGEGGLGADGFVAVLKASDSQLEWVAFFENSNPFVEVELRETEVLAKTNLSNTWRFPLDSPAQVTVD